MTLTPDMGIDAGPPSGYLFVGTVNALETGGSTDPALAMVTANLTVTRRGLPVDNLQVLINPAPPSVKTVLVETVAGSGVYTGNWIGFQGSFRLTVNANQGHANLIEDVPIGGPSIQSVTAPASGAIVDTTMPLAVTWSAAEVAPSCAVSTPSMTFATADDGSYSLPAGALTATVQDGGPQPSWVAVTRSLADPIAGVAAGSQITFSVEVQVPVGLRPLPYTPPDMGSPDRRTPDAGSVDAPPDAPHKA